MAERQSEFCGPRRAMPIETALLWAYREQRVDQVEGSSIGLQSLEAMASGIGWGSHSGCGCYDVERIARLGTTIGGGGPSSAVAHVDAVTLHRAVEGLGSDAAGRLIRVARIQVAPSWSPGRAKVVPLTPNTRRPADLVWRSSDGLDYCPIRTIGGQSEARLLREQYAAWHAALERAFEAARGLPYRELEIRVPLIEAEPWKVSGRPAMLDESEFVAFASAYQMGSKPGKLAREFGLAIAQVYELCKRVRAEQTARNSKAG